MERPVRPLRHHPTLSKQVSLLDDECDEGVEDGGDLLPDTPPTHPHSHTPPPTPPGARGVSPPSPSTSFSHHHNGSPHGPGPGGGGGGGMNCSHGGSNHCSAGHGAGQGHVAQGPGRSKSLELHHQRSTDSDKEAPLVTSARHRHHGDKPKRLQRSHAMREDSSPPPELLEGVPPTSSHPSTTSGGGNTLTVTASGGGRRRIKHQGSSQGSFDGSSPCLSRDSSMEYTDSSGVDLQQFIIQTLHKNQKDRMMLLKIEHELVSLVKDSKRTHHKFPPMSSYQRMLVHRCAAFFGLEHNVDQAGTAVIVNRTRNTRLPETRFRDHCRDDLLVPDEPKRSILKRDSSSFDDSSNYKSLSSTDGLGDSPVRSHDSRRNSQDDSRWHETRHWTFMDSEASHRKHHYDNHRLRPGRLPKVESFESRDTLHPRSLRPPVFKSHSFGGYSGGVTVLSRGDSVSSNISSRLSKQDSTSSRISDQSMSSGYKSQRQDTSSTNVSNTLSTTPSPTTSQHQHSAAGQVGVWGGEGDSQPVMWAVTDMEAVPPGAMLINPQSGQPYMNSDGSVYRFDPNNPPQLSPGVSSSSSGVTATQEKESVSDKETSSQPSGLLYHKSTKCTYSEGISGGPLSSPVSPSQSTPTSHQGSSSGSLTTCVTQVPAVSPPTSHDLPQPASANIHSPPSKQLSLQQSSPEPTQGVVTGSVSGGETRESEMPAASGGSTGSEGVTQPTPQVIYPQYYPLEARSYSQEGHVSEVASHMRALCLSGHSGNEAPGDIVAGQVTAAPVPGPGPQSYVVPRQHYTQPVYYMPAGSVGNLNGSLKYVYPQYQMAPVQAPAGVQAQAGVQPAGMQQVQGIPAVPAVPPLTGGVPAAPGPPTAHHPSMEHTPALPPGGYTVVTYPAAGSVSGTGSGQEAGGTTYYYQLPSAPAGSGISGPLPPGQPVPTSLHQYTLTPSTTTTTFPQMGSSLGYYTASGLPGGGVYQAVGGMQGVSGGMYSSPPGPAPAGHATAVSYRAPTPPQTPSTQGMSLSLGYVSGGSGGTGVAPAGGQYMAMVPPQQPPTPTSHAPPPQLFTTFFRPSVQMMGGSAGTPPPQSVLQYGGGAVPPSGPPGTVTPHPPVFAKPYMGPAMHTMMPGTLPEQAGLGKEDKRLMAMTQGVGGTPTGPAAQLLARPYSIMQSDMRIFGGTSGLPNTGGMSGGSLAGSGAPAPLRAGPLLLAGTRPRHPNAFTPTPLAPLSLARPPKVRRQRSRTSYTRSSEVMTPQMSVEGQESNE